MDMDKVGAMQEVLAMIGLSAVDIDTINRELIQRNTRMQIVPCGMELQSFAVDDQHRETPINKTGKRHFCDKDSFADYVNKHKVVGATMLYGRISSQSVSCCFDDHADEIPGLQVFHAHYEATTRKEWQELVALDAKSFIKHSEFIDAIEDLVPYIDKPAGAEVFDKIRNFQNVQRVDFKRAVCTDTGQIEFSYSAKEGTEGGNGTVSFPHDIEFVMRPFRDLPEAVRVKARIKYRVNITDGTLSMRLKLERIEDVEEKAFRALCDHVEKNVSDIRILWVA